MVDLDHVPVGAGLLVAEDRAQRCRGLHGHVVGPERLEPRTARVQQQRLRPPVRLLEQRARVLPRTVGSHHGDRVGEHRRLRRVAHQVDPHAVTGLEQRGAGLTLRHADGQRLRRPLDPAPVHRHRHQRTLRQRRVRGTGVAGALAGDEAGDDADRREVGRAPARDRAAEVDRSVAKPLLLVEHAEARHREQLVDRQVGVGVVRRPRRAPTTRSAAETASPTTRRRARARGARRTVVVHDDVGRGE